MRYALYFAPAPETALAAAGAEWLGRDAFTGDHPPRPTVPGVDADRFTAMTSSPRRYGFHATLKAPFPLAEGTDAAELRSAVAAFAATRPAFSVPLTVAQIEGFIALVPALPSTDLDLFAEAVTLAFERFRLPLAPEDLERRRRAGLTERQDELLTAYGYPYVLDEFRFHMTLSARVTGSEADYVMEAAREHFAGTLDEPVAIDCLSLFVEPAPGEPFAVLDTARLADA